VISITLWSESIDGDQSFGTQMADIMRLVATDVTGGLITDSGHWAMEEQSKQTDPPPMKWSDLRYVFDIKAANAQETLQA
jgi:hypothetical protein